MGALKIVCTSIFIFFGFLKASKQPYDLAVNLGGDCQVEYQLKRNILRTAASPFATLNTPVNSLIQLLQNKFAHFLAKKNLVVISEDQRLHVEDLCYQIRSSHDFKFEGNKISNYNLIKQQYKRRIKRLYALIERAKNILFIRKNINKADALALITVLRTLFGSKKFTLLALDSTEEIKQDWGIAGVKNMFLQQTNPYIWTGDDQAWHALFAQFRFHIMLMQQT